MVWIYNCGKRVKKILQFQKNSELQKKDNSMVKQTEGKTRTTWKCVTYRPSATQLEMNFYVFLWGFRNLVTKSQIQVLPPLLLAYTPLRKLPSLKFAIYKMQLDRTVWFQSPCCWLVHWLLSSSSSPHRPPSSQPEPYSRLWNLA